MAKAKNTTVNLNALSNEELQNRMADAQLQLSKLKFSHAITPIENPLAIKILRRQIARLQTAIRFQQLAS